MDDVADPLFGVLHNSYLLDPPIRDCSAICTLPQLRWTWPTSQVVLNRIATPQDYNDEPKVKMKVKHPTKTNPILGKRLQHRTQEAMTVTGRVFGNSTYNNVVYTRETSNVEPTQ
ncbi:hypothetical protein BgiBS90_025028 [Biomphalaria glabrata]|nr:hypothetical protein BgiBS90_025028 [Biomphalaria glabrata]